jgi:hypothetical protein
MITIVLKVEMIVITVHDKRDDYDYHNDNIYK